MWINMLQVYNIESWFKYPQKWARLGASVKNCHWVVESDGLVHPSSESSNPYQSGSDKSIVCTALIYTEW